MKEIIITPNQIKKAIQDLVNENEMLQDKVYKLEDIIKEVRETLNNKRQKLTEELLTNGYCDYEELLYQLDEEIGRILNKVGEE